MHIQSFVTTTDELDQVISSWFNEFSAKKVKLNVLHLEQLKLFDNQVLTTMLYLKETFPPTVPPPVPVPHSVPGKLPSAETKQPTESKKS